MFSIFIMFSLGLLMTYHAIMFTGNTWLFGVGACLQIAACISYIAYKNFKDKENIKTIIDICYQVLLTSGVIRIKKKDKDNDDKTAV